MKVDVADVHAAISTKLADTMTEIVRMVSVQRSRVQGLSEERPNSRATPGASRRKRRTSSTEPPEP